MTKLTGTTPDIAKENIEHLRELFPEVFMEDKIDFEKLRQVLGEYVAESKEEYSFTWNGKGQALKLSQTPTTGTLRPCKEESKDWETTKNLYIEGDNLEVLKLLQKSYFGKVKMIYIDPPYNTGKDFVYKDDFRDNIDNYKKITGQVDSEGQRISTNSETSGRYHTNWLNMMYPRLRLARNLLTEDGAIFISIDDNEVANLRKICDEIFGEDNFEGEITWRRRHNQPNDASKMIAKVSEYIICYSKNSNKLKENKTFYGIPLSEKRKKEYTNPDNDPRGAWDSKPWKVGTGQGGSLYSIKLPSGNILTEIWMGNEATYKKLLSENLIYFPKEGEGSPRKKFFLAEREKEGQSANTFWTFEQFGSNQDASNELEKLFEEKGIFDNPKPTKLLKSLVKLVTKENELCLDFFSGSATTAHAVMQLNAEDGGNRQYISVQLNENLDHSIKIINNDNKQTIKSAIEFLDSIKKPHYLTEIGKERIRRAGEKIKEEKGDLANNLDIGFKVFKLDSSNLLKWQPKEEKADLNALKEELMKMGQIIVTDRNNLDVVYEIMLKMGLDLTYSVEEKTIADKKVYSIAYGQLMICLDNDINVDVAQGMIELYKELNKENSDSVWKVVFKDSGFTSSQADSIKISVKERFKQAGLEETAFITI